MHDGFMSVTQAVPDAVLDIRYAGTYNFVGEPIDGYLAHRALLTREAASALSRAADTFRRDGYRVVVYDAYRPQRAVDHFVRWAGMPDERMRAAFYPDLEKGVLFERGYIARRSGHSRGSTIDLTICRMDGESVDMGGPFDFFGPVSAHGARGITDQQAQNRAYLCGVMEASGFCRYDEEWWHYTLAGEPYPETYFDFPID